MINTRKSSLLYKILAFIGKRIISSIEFFISKCVKAGVIFPDTDFEWIKEIEGHYPEILEEYENLLKEKRLTDISQKVEEQQIVVDKDKWLFFPLYAYGYPIHKNIQLCPKTNQAIKKIPRYSGVFFSTITPGTYIKPHRGLYKGYLRFHLGLIVPEELEANKTCRIRI